MFERPWVSRSNLRAHIFFILDYKLRKNFFKSYFLNMCPLNSGCLLGEVNLGLPPSSWGSECMGMRAHVNTTEDPRAKGP